MVSLQLYNSKDSLVDAKETAKLLNYGITNFDLIEIYNSSEDTIELDVWLGKKNKVKSYIKDNIYKTIPKANNLLKLKFVN